MRKLCEDGSTETCLGYIISTELAQSRHLYSDMRPNESPNTGAFLQEFLWLLLQKSYRNQLVSLECLDRNLHPLSACISGLVPPVPNNACAAFTMWKLWEESGLYAVPPNMSHVTPFNSYTNVHTAAES
jgi:hypothetical protein